MLQGLYKVEMHTVHGSRRGVLYFYDGKMMGGSSAFAFIGTYREFASGEVLADMLTLRHNEDRNFQPLLKTDIVTLTLKGRQQGDQYYFEGGAPQLPGVAFYAVMTPISEEAAPPISPVGQGGISNGLYSIHIRMLDGIDGGNTGVMMLHDGRIHGGDAYFDYIGSYTSLDGRWKASLSITSTRQVSASGRFSEATRSASAFPAPIPTKARSRKRLRLSASAAFASARY
jgi:T3SS negative regulator,GrlR